MHEGQIVGGYRIDLLVGEGAAGWVYQGEAIDDDIRQRLDNPVVAIKILKPQAMANAQIVASFHYEARILRRLDHPSILKAYDTGDDGEFLYLVTELIPGQPLNAVLGKAKRFTAGRTGRIGTKLAIALGHLHDQGYVHRDLKPSNVMLTEDDDVRIMDLGTVVPSNSPITYEHGVFGTPSFLAPEQARQDPTVDGRADLYALGVMMFLMATGDRPFSGLRDDVLVAQVETPAPAASSRADVPGALDAVIARLLMKEPGDRFQHGRELAEALEPVAAIPDPAHKGIRRLFSRR